MVPRREAHGLDPSLLWREAHPRRGFLAVQIVEGDAWWRVFGASGHVQKVASRRTRRDASRQVGALRQPREITLTTTSRPSAVSTGRNFNRGQPRIQRGPVPCQERRTGRRCGRRRAGMPRGLSGPRSGAWGLVPTVLGSRGDAANGGAATRLDIITSRVTIRHDRVLPGCRH